MNDLKVFESAEFGKVRVVQKNGEPWFVAADVCGALEVDRTQTRRLDDDEKGVYSIPTPGGEQKMTVINEPGLYSLVLVSRKPEAKAFKRWITHDVIPAIRKTGGYIVWEESMSDDELMAKALIMAQRKIAERDKRIADLNVKAAIYKPKVVFADAIIAYKSSIIVGNLAKMLRKNQLFKWLRKNHYLCSKVELNNMHSQPSMETEIKESTTVNPDESIRIHKTPRVTGKGQRFFINKFLAERD